MDIQALIGTQKYHEVLSQSKEERQRAEAEYNARNTNLNLQQEMLRRQQEIDKIKMSIAKVADAFPFQTVEYVNLVLDLKYAETTYDILKEFYELKF